MNILFLYHKFCRDGFAAAAVSFKYYSSLNQEIKIKYKGLDPGDLQIEELIDNYPSDFKVIAFDLSFTYQEFMRLCGYFPSLEIWDHHLSTKEKCIDILWESENPEKFDLVKKIHYIEDKCAAVIAYQYYFPKEDVPLFLKYIQDRDLFKETQPYSEEISAGLFEDLPLEFRFPSSSGNSGKVEVLLAHNDTQIPKFYNWIEFMNNEDWFPRIKENGRIVVKLKNKSITQTSRSAQLCLLQGLKVYMVNITDSYISDTCQVLYNRKEFRKIQDENLENKSESYLCDYVMAWRLNHFDNKIYISLRSRQETGADVSKIAFDFAESFEGKGGGHKHASGFECTLDYFYNQILTKIVPIE